MTPNQKKLLHTLTRLVIFTLTAYTFFVVYSATAPASEPKQERCITDLGVEWETELSCDEFNKLF